MPQCTYKRIAALLCACAWVYSIPARAADVEQQLAELRVLVLDVQRENQRLREELSELRSAEDASRSIASAADSSTPRLTLRGFADAGARVAREDPSGAPARSLNGFGLGGVDLFATSQISDEVSALGEFVFEAHEQGTEFELERIQLAWEAHELLKLTLGRGHTRLGYWNHRFHHGSFLQTTIERPNLYGFEDDGGLLPIHFVGIEASGTWDAPAGALSYALTLANGRGRTPTDVEDAVDSNRGKSLMLSMAFAPGAFPGFELGANAGHDHVPGGGSPLLTSSFDEWIYGGFAAYTLVPFELIVEAQWLRHQNVAGADALSKAGYLQLAYQWGRWKPYYRFDWADIGEESAWLAQSPLEDTQQHIGGLRFDWLTFAAIKLELLHADSDSVDFDAIRSQLSFSF